MPRGAYLRIQRPMARHQMSPERKKQKYRATKKLARWRAANEAAKAAAPAPKTAAKK